MEPLQEPTPLCDPASIWRRSAAHPAAANLWRELDEIIERKRFGEGGPQIKGEPADFDETSANAYGRALEWLTKALALADALDVGDEPGLSDVITHANLVIATNNWIDRRGSSRVSHRQGYPARAPDQARSCSHDLPSVIRQGAATAYRSAAQQAGAHGVGRADVGGPRSLNSGVRYQPGAAARRGSNA